MDLIHHQVIIRRDIERRIEHAGIGNSRREIRAIDRFTTLTNKRRRFVFHLLLLFLAVIDIQSFRSVTKPYSHHDHTYPRPPVTFARGREEIDETKKESHEIEDQVDLPLHIDEHRPEIAMQIAGHIKGLGIEQDMIVSHVDEVRHEPGIHHERQA